MRRVTMCLLYTVVRRHSDARGTGKSALQADMDRVGNSTFPLTQEFISHMLGTRSASVTVAAGILQKAGLITYSRGQVSIEDRAGLESAACECYQGITRQIERWRQDSQ